MADIKFIYWFAYYNLDSPSVRYRAKYPLEFGKEELGIGYYLIIPGYSFKKIFLFLRAFFSALFFRKKDSLIVIQRVQSDFIYSNFLKILIAVRKKNTVYDIDDADYLEYGPEIIHYFAQKCEYISAGSQKIVEYFNEFNALPYHITSPTPDLGIVKEKKNSIFTIGWVGGFEWGHKESLYTYLFQAIKNLSFPCKLIIVSVSNADDRLEIRNFFKDFRNIELEMPLNIDWKNEPEIQKKITDFDVGIATLCNNAIQLSKSGIKVKQYMNSGVPVLSVDLPENNRFILNGVNGFLCNSVFDFERRLIQFREMNDEEYNKFSKNARASIENFNYLNHFKSLKEMINISRKEN